MSPDNCSVDLASGDGGGPAAASQAQQGDAAVDALGGEFSNTPPSITKCLGSEDWIEQAYYLDHRDFAGLKKRFDAAREASESNVPGGDELEIAGRKFLMQPSGALAGSKGKQVAYRWRLRSEDGWWLLLMNRSQPHETIPNGIVRASSLPLLRLGSLGYLHQVEETLKDLRIRLVREKLSRVDPCADLSDLPIDNLYQAFMQGHFVSRARYTTDRIAEESYEGYRIGRKPTGFEFGRGGAVMSRTYDKARKCRNDSEMLLLMQTRRWGDVGAWATRVEFELRREKLKALGVDSIAQWWEKRGSICHYLSHEWCRVTAEEVDPHHPDRAATHPDWVKFQDAFKEWSGKPIAKLEPLTRLPVKADHLLSLVVGALISYHARVGNCIDSNENFTDASVDAIFDFIYDRDLPMEVWRRALELGAPRP